MLFKTLQLKSQKYLREVNDSVPTLIFPSCCFIGIHFTTERDKTINKNTNIHSRLHPHGSVLIATLTEMTELKFATALLFTH